MLLGSRFPGDTSLWVMNLQHDSYVDTLITFADSVVERGLYAEHLLGLLTSDIGDFCRHFRSRKAFDYRILESAHDDIAANFRFRFHRWPLFAQPGDPVETLAAWQAYAIEEFQLHMNGIRFATGCFDALRFPNLPRGFAGESAMQNVLHQRYYAMYNHVLPNWTPEEDLTPEELSATSAHSL